MGDHFRSSRLAAHIQQPSKHFKIKMKAFTTVAALLGATYANPIQHIQYGTTGMRQINNLQINSSNHNNMQQQMSVQRTVSDVSHPKPVVSPNQYFLQDDFGNFAYGYSTQNSERAEEGNGNTVKGHFANIMADGKLRRVDYIADDQGFHILRDTADNTRRFIKREAEADNIQLNISTSASLRDSTQDAEMSAKMSMTPNTMLGHDMSMNNMRDRNNQMSSNMYMSSDMMGRDMSSNMMANKAMGQKMYTMGQDMSSTMMGHDMSSPNMGKMMRQNKYQIVPSWDETVMEHNMDKTMMGNNVDKTMMGHNMHKAKTGNNMDKTQMGHNMDNTNMGAPMVQAMLGHNMDKTMMGSPMVQTMLGHNNMVPQNTRFNMFGFPMMGHGTYTNMMGRDMSSNMMGNNMYSNMMGRDMASNMVGQDMPSHMMDRSMMGSQDMYTNANLMGRDMNRMAPLNMMSHKMQIETMPSQSFTRFF